MLHFDFKARSPRLAKRRALAYWYQNQSNLGLSMRQFFERCRIREEGGESYIRFYPDSVA